MKRTIIPFLLVTLLATSCTWTNDFSEPPDHPVIDSLSPSAGRVGTQLRLYGSGFSTYPSLNTVRINGVLVRVDSPATSRVMLVTITDSTGTGHVQVKVFNQSADGPVFTWLKDTVKAVPVITAVEYGWYDGTGYAVTMKTVPAEDSVIRLKIGGVPAPIYEVTRAGRADYDPTKGSQLLVLRDETVTANANGIYASFVASFNGVSSAPFPFQIKPVLSMISSPNGQYKFAAGDIVTFTGNFFGDPTLPSSLDIQYNGLPLTPAPQIVSWKNTEIKAVMPVYSNVPAGAYTAVAVKIGEKESYSFPCSYMGAVTATVSLIAGSGPGNTNGHGTAAAFNNPKGIALDASGNLYVADQGNNCIREITNISGSGGDVTTLAGSTAGFLDGTAANAQFNQPAAVAVDENGRVYVADFANNRIRVIGGGSVYTFAGDGTAALFWYPTGIATINHNNVYVADMNNHRIRLILNSNLFTLAGSTAGFVDGGGSSAKFNQPYGVAIGTDGTVYVADEQNHAIRDINVDKMVSTLAGGSNGAADGTGTAAQFGIPVAVAVDASGNVYVADNGNPRIRKITPGGAVTTITAEFADGSGLALFSAPSGIALDPQGNIYISDAGTHRIYKMTLK